MSDNNEQFERLSFWRLLGKKIIIEIPIIQRAYAQGRENKQKVRENFLEALYGALAGNSDKFVELDFVYGSEKESVLQHSVFQPLDGQQRLTTLFLLHWYIAAKENKTDDYKKRLEIRNEKDEIIRKKFSYKTRASSLEFCDELTAYSINFDNLLISDIDKEGQSKNNELSKTIKNSSWFVSSWEKDPTIASMLIMLDAIHLKFKNTNKLWERLVDEQNPPITFLYVLLEKFGLSDDLYIKMNARGKQLTAFENFKSQFEKYIEIKEYEKNITNTEEQFAHKIDTVWTDLFWQYREKQKDNSYSIDAKIINFIAGIAINYYAEKSEIAENEEIKENIRKELSEKGNIKNVTDNAVKKERIERRIQQLANNSVEISPEDFSTKESFEYLIKCFNKYAEKQNEAYEISTLKPDLSLWNYCDNSLFEDFIQYSKPQYKLRVLFYAQTVYLLKNSNFDAGSFSDWMRVIRNIVENSLIEHPGDFISAVNLVKELSNGCMDIYAHLADNKEFSGHAKEQMKEEVEKAKIIAANKNNKKVIHKTEDTNFCKGKIDFALYCIDYDINKTPVISSFNPEKLGKICKVLKDYLSEEDVTNDFRRAFFTIKNNDFYNYWGSWLFVVGARKKCIIENITDLKINFAFSGEDNSSNIYLKELILKLSEKDIDTIINDYISNPDFNKLPNWKKRIIKEEGLLDYSIKHYIAIKEDDSCCWLIPGTKVSNDDNGKKRLKIIE